MKVNLADKLDVCDLGKATYFLGLELTRIREALNPKADEVNTYGRASRKVWTSGCAGA